MRALSVAAQAAVASHHTKPLYLIELDLSPAIRVCTYDTVTWSSVTWSGDVKSSVQVSGVSGDGRQSATLEISNETGAIGAVMLGSSTTDKRVRIWGGDASALAAADPVLVFDGVISGAEVDTEIARINLVSQGSRTTRTPRRYIDKAGGFNVLLPAGTQITVGGNTVILERSR